MTSTLTILHDLRNRIWSNLLWILLGSVVIAGISALLTRSIKGEYGAYSKIFPLSINQSSGGNSPLDAIRAQFGISDKTDYDKIYNVKELVGSRTISTIIARSKPTHSSFKTMSEWLIDDYNKNLPFWKKKIIINPADTNELHYVGSSLVVSNTEVVNDPKTNFTTITTHSHQPELTQEMNEKTLVELSNFYIKLVTEKPRTDLDKIKIMRDSLQHELYASERSIAGFIDSNQLSVKTSTQLPQYKLQRMQREIEELYTITATSFQNAKFKLLSESPIFQVLDKAGPPYDFTRPSWFRMGMLAFILSFLFLSIWVCRLVLWRIILQELSGS